MNRWPMSDISIQAAGAWRIYIQIREGTVYYCAHTNVLKCLRTHNVQTSLAGLFYISEGENILVYIWNGCSQSVS